MMFHTSRRVLLQIFAVLQMEKSEALVSIDFQSIKL